MMNQLVAVAALFSASAVALVTAPGQAIVVNKCSYNVDLNNVPAANQGGTAESKTLAPGDSYAQNYQELEFPHDGWSIKLKPSSDTSGAIIQFEYTYLPFSTLIADVLWFDMSYVNGDPFKEDWKFSSDASSCSATLTGNAYTNPWDDAQGMQKPCTGNDSVTLTLCDSGSASPSGSSGSSSSSATSWAPSSSQVSVEPSAPATTFATSWTPTTTATPSTTVAPAPFSIPSFSAPAVPSAGSPFSQHHEFAVNENNVVAHGDSASSSPSPLSMSSSPSDSDSSDGMTYITSGNTVIAVETAWVTSFKTVDFPAPTGDVHKRHMHHGAHHA